MLVQTKQSEVTVTVTSNGGSNSDVLATGSFEVPSPCSPKIP